MVATIPVPTDPVSAVAGVVQSIINRFPDPTAQAAAQQQLAQMSLSGELQQMTTQAGVITAEANSANKLASSWRPMLMYCFMAVIVNNYLIAPYLQALFHTSVIVPIPPDMWSLLKIGVGGYVFCRTGEKMVTQGVHTQVASAVGTAAGAASAAVTNMFKGH
jgi:hypothetical protein